MYYIHCVRLPDIIYFIHCVPLPDILRGSFPGYYINKFCTFAGYSPWKFPRILFTINIVYLCRIFYVEVSPDIIYFIHCVPLPDILRGSFPGYYVNKFCTFAGYSPWKFPPDIISPVSANTIFIGQEYNRFRMCLFIIFYKSLSEYWRWSISFYFSFHSNFKVPNLNAS